MFPSVFRGKGTPRQPCGRCRVLRFALRPIFPPPVTTGYNPATRARRVFSSLAAFAGGVWWLSRRVHYWRRYYRVGGVSTYASIPTRPRGGGGIAPPPCLPCQYVKKRAPLAGGLCTAPAVWRCPCVVLFAPVRGIAPRRAGVVSSGLNTGKPGALFIGAQIGVIFRQRLQAAAVLAST